VQQLAGVLAGRPDVDERLAEVGEDVLAERPDRGVVALDDRVLDHLRLGCLGGDLAILGDPLGPAAVEDAHVGVAEQGEHPQRVSGPPVVAVAVEHHGGVAADAALAADLGEAGAVDVVARDGVVQLGVPVELHRAGDVAGVVEQHVLVGLDDDQPGFAQVLGEPGGGDQALGVGVVGELGVVVLRHGHARHISRAATAP
jgi:hypothetical protein